MRYACILALDEDAASAADHRIDVLDFQVL
jgi:hypothetical protein